jgi:DNA-binding NarL/FixJ family response regulator
MTSTEQRKIAVMCVDDNPLVADAVRIKLARTGEFEVSTWLSSADGLLEAARKLCPQMVLLDLDMPGVDPLKAAEEMMRLCPHSKIIVFSGHVRADLIEKALQAGAWGYVSKHDAENELVSVMRLVSKNQIAFSTEARATYDRQ